MAHQNTPVLFWDVDTQVDFMQPDGKLYVPGAEEILPWLGGLTMTAREKKIPLIASADDHQLSDPEISTHPDFRTTYPPHCLHGTPGAERIGETRHWEAVEIGHEALSDPEIDYLTSAKPPVLRILKKRFDVFSNPNTERLVAAIAPWSIVVYGVALDVCVRAAVEGLLARDYEVHVVTDAVKALDTRTGETLLADWARRGVKMTTTSNVMMALGMGRRR